MKDAVRYSEAFKRSAAGKAEGGGCVSLSGAGRKNGIRGSGTLVNRIKKYGREDVLPKRIRVETMNGIDGLKELRKQNKELKAALADAHMDWCLESAFLDIACGEMGTAAEALKKKQSADACGRTKEKGARMNYQTNVKGFFQRLGMSCQNYYKGRTARKKACADAALICFLVLQERAIQPCLGGRKLYCILSAKLAKNGVKLGRDRFFNVLRDSALLLERLPSFAPKTTNSRRYLPVFRNLVKDMTLTGRNQARAGGITCVRTDEGFIYLALISDMRPRKIAGYHAGNTLEAEGALAALKMAAAGLGEGEKPVHHSDRGCQYCCHAYIDGLTKHGLRVSMTEEAHCYGNALAGRLNGILKQEYGLGGTFKSKAYAAGTIDEAFFCLTRNGLIYHCAAKHRTGFISRLSPLSISVNLFQYLTGRWYGSTVVR